MIPTEVKVKIAQLGKASPDQEVCGVVLKDNQVIDLPNVADNPVDDFAIEQVYIDELHEDIKWIWHTHWREDSPAYLTDTDIKASRSTGFPYIVYHVEYDQWDFWDKNFPHPFPLEAKGNPTSLDYYKGWPWWANRSDCLSVMRGYYKGILGIHVNDYDRSNLYRELRRGTWNAYEENLPNEGFNKVYEGVNRNYPLNQHDLVLIACENGVQILHHIGIIVDKGKILHHLQPNSLSRVDRLDIFFNFATSQKFSVWRHNEFS